MICPHCGKDTDKPLNVTVGEILPDDGAIIDGELCLLVKTVSAKRPPRKVDGVGVRGGITKEPQIFVFEVAE